MRMLESSDLQSKPRHFPDPPLALRAHSFLTPLDRGGLRHTHLGGTKVRLLHAAVATGDSLSARPTQTGTGDGRCSGFGEPSQRRVAWTRRAGARPRPVGALPGRMEKRYFPGLPPLPRRCRAAPGGRKVLPTMRKRNFTACGRACASARDLGLHLLQLSFTKCPPFSAFE